MHKILTAAVREFRVTAITWAFLIGAVIAPAAIWGLMIVLSASGVLAQDRAPLEGTIAVVDATEGETATAGIELVFDAEYQAELRKRQLEQIEQVINNSSFAQAIPPGQLAQAKAMAAQFAGSAQDTNVLIERLDGSLDDKAIDTQKQRVLDGELLALIVVGENTVALPIDRVAEDTIEAAEEDEAEEGEAEQDAKSDAATDEQPTETASADSNEATAADQEQQSLGSYELYHSVSLDPEYLGQIERAVHRAVQDERYRRAGIDPEPVLLIASYPPRANATVVSVDGKEVDSNADLIKILPFIFMFLLFGAVMTGGQYLLMGTLEEKQSRVMEVLLSAVSPTQLLIGKMMGQMCVGLSILCIYGGVGVLAANRFGFGHLVPAEQLPLYIAYFLMAYLYLGTLMVSVGAAVTELREAQALYPPITISIILPFILLIAIMENPASIIARIFSYFPPTTPFVMVMRISQPAYPVPWWEIAATLLVGFAFVAFMVTVAARIFRVGVLQYGKAPSLLGLLKWARA